MTAPDRSESSSTASARPAPLHWEKIHVYPPRALGRLRRLGLTHSTKNGYTRDGKQGVPDPTFPPGLTDVVPYDADKLLLVRGTTGGLSLFRSAGRRRRCARRRRCTCTPN